MVCDADVEVDDEPDLCKPARILQTSKGHNFSSLLQRLPLLLLTSWHASSPMGPFPESTDCMPGLQGVHSVVRCVSGVHWVVVLHVVVLQVGVVRVHSVVVRVLHIGVLRRTKSGERVGYVDVVRLHFGERVVHWIARVVQVGERVAQVGEGLTHCGDLVEQVGDRVEQVELVGDFVVHAGVVDIHGTQDGERRAIAIDGERRQIGVHSILCGIRGEQVVLH